MPSSACARVLRSPHSFPTRRSSDLRRAAPRRGRAAARRRWLALARDDLRAAGLVGLGARRAGDRPRPARDRRRRRDQELRLQRLVRRSEEHTSELQSPCNLVCRLLLALASSDLLTPSLHDALPICAEQLLDEAGLPRGAGGWRWRATIYVPQGWSDWVRAAQVIARGLRAIGVDAETKNFDFNAWYEDRKSTRLNSSHLVISYAVFCLRSRPPISSLLPYTTLFRSAPSSSSTRPGCRAAPVAGAGARRSTCRRAGRTGCAPRR